MPSSPAAPQKQFNLPSGGVKTYTPLKVPPSSDRFGAGNIKTGLPVTKDPMVTFARTGDFQDVDVAGKDPLADNWSPSSAHPVRKRYLMGGGAL